VLLPTHPGFGGTPRPESLTSVADLAGAYVALLDKLDLSDVTVAGNSFGGWLAAEIALLGSPRVTAAVLIDAIGAEVPGHPVADAAAMTPSELAAHAWHDPSRAPAPSSGPTPDLRALAAYTGAAMSDPALLDRLTTLDLPVHVIWGESDRIVDTAHARALAAAIPKSRLTILPATGHLPQLETPDAVLAAVAQAV
jgi:pimeloyl-ACP methyl ester carboxylesterase